jgi:hypothetical protein
VTEKLSKSLFLIIKSLIEIFDEISPEKNSDKTCSTHTDVWASSNVYHVQNGIKLSLIPHPRLKITIPTHKDQK